MENAQTSIEALAPTRIAVYDDMLAAPRIIDIDPTEISEYIEHIAATTYELAQQKGSSIPYTVIKEVCENFIHAQFKDPCISILDGGNTIKFTDQGPGIEDKRRAQLPGFTSATSEMRKYIRGVGSGLPTVKDYLSFSNGRLIIEDNIKEGAVVTIQIDGTEPRQQTVVYHETSDTRKNDKPTLSDDEYNILALAHELGSIGPTDLKQNLDIALATGHRRLNELEEAGLLARTDNGKKRTLTSYGMSLLS